LGLQGREYRPDQDVSSWLRFNLTAYHQQAQAVQGRWDRWGAAWEALSEFVAMSRLDGRVVAALHDVAMTGAGAPLPVRARRGPQRPAGAA
jgi:hypothetical protein